MSIQNSISAPECFQEAADSRYAGFTRKEWLIFCILIIAGLLLRWLELDARPIHHDESLHGMYGIYYFDWPNDRYYRYDPMLHGPLLYNLYPLVYYVFGISDWSIRALIAVLGSLMTFLPFLFRRYFTNPTLLWLTAALSLSPTEVYWSRLVHHDLLVLVGWFLMLYAATLAADKRRALYFFCGLAVQFVVKANVYITLAILLGYLVFEAAFAPYFQRPGETLLSRLTKYISKNIQQCLAGLLVGLFIFVYYYTGGFRYSGALLGCSPGEDNCHSFIESFTYWLHNHNIERISGPFLFHFYLLGWYELAFILAWFFQLFLLYRKAGPVFRGAGLGSLIFALLCAFFGSSEESLKFPVWAFFKLKDGLDLFGLIFLGTQAVIVTCYHLWHSEKALAFFGYFFLATFFSYSFAGEKTPWLAIYPHLAGLVYLALYFQDYFARYPIPDWREFPLSKTFYFIAFVCMALFAVFMFEDAEQKWQQNIYAPLFGLVALIIAVGGCGTHNLRATLFVLMCVFTLRSSIQTNFTYAGRANELLCQVHTTHDFDDVMTRIRDEMLAAPEDKRPQVLVSGESVWPTVWYLRSLPVRYEATPEQKKDFKYIFQDWKDNPTDIPEGFELRKLNLRGWWVPDFKSATLKKYLYYWWNHKPWTPNYGGDASGYSYVALLTRK